VHRHHVRNKRDTVHLNIAHTGINCYDEKQTVYKTHIIQHSTQFTAVIIIIIKKQSCMSFHNQLSQFSTNSGADI